MTARSLSVLSLSVVLALSLSAGGGLSAAQSEASRPATPPADRIWVAHARTSANLLFIENAGQFDARAHFQVRGGSGTLWLADDALWFTLLERPPADTLQPQTPMVPERFNAAHDVRPHRGVNVKLSFVGANPHPRLEPFSRLDTHVSYFSGNDSTKWHTDVPAWGGVRYMDLYPGIDLELSGASGQWQPRVIVHPGADLSAVRLRVEGADGLALEGGRVHLTTAVGELSLPLLRAVTSDGSPLPELGARLGMRTNEIAAPFAMDNSPEVSYQDNPVGLPYSTFLGGGNWDDGRSIVVDASGAAYITGNSNSSNFPTTPGVFQMTCSSCPGWPDAFVTKLLPVATPNRVYLPFILNNGSLEDRR